jgi:transposase-like protein
MRVRRSKEEWEKLIQEQKKSGKSIAGFCKENSIHPNLFYRRIKTTNKHGGFVKIQAPIMRSNAITIRCGNISVYIPVACTKEVIILVLQSMKEAGYAEVS